MLPNLKAVVRHDRPLVNGMGFLQRFSIAAGDEPARGTGTHASSERT